MAAQQQGAPQNMLVAIRIKDGLFVGNVVSSQDDEFLFMNKVTHIVNCAGTEAPNLFQSAGINYMTYHWRDLPNTVLFDAEDRNVAQCYQFIEKGLEKGECVLVQSYYGTSRCCCVVAAYLMLKFGWTLDNTLNFMFAGHPDMQIKPYFMRQLKAYAKRHETGMDIFHPAVDISRLALDNEQWVLRNTFMNSLAYDHSNNGELRDCVLRAESDRLHRTKPKKKRVIWTDTKKPCTFQLENSAPIIPSSVFENNTGRHPSLGSRQAASILAKRIPPNPHPLLSAPPTASTTNNNNTTNNNAPTTISFARPPVPQPETPPQPPPTSVPTAVDGRGGATMTQRELGLDDSQAIASAQGFIQQQQQQHSQFQQGPTPPAGSYPTMPSPFPTGPAGDPSDVLGGGSNTGYAGGWNSSASSVSATAPAPGSAAVNAAASSYASPSSLASLQQRINALQAERSRGQAMGMGNSLAGAASGPAPGPPGTSSGFAGGGSVSQSLLANSNGNTSAASNPVYALQQLQQQQQQRQQQAANQAAAAQQQNSMLQQWRVRSASLQNDAQAQQQDSTAASRVASPSPGPGLDRATQQKLTTQQHLEQLQRLRQQQQQQQQQRLDTVPLKLNSPLGGLTSSGGSNRDLLATASPLGNLGYGSSDRNQNVPQHSRYGNLQAEMEQLALNQGARQDYLREQDDYRRANSAGAGIDDSRPAILRGGGSLVGTTAPPVNSSPASRLNSSGPSSQQSLTNRTSSPSRNALLVAGGPTPGGGRGTSPAGRLSGSTSDLLGNGLGSLASGGYGGGQAPSPSSRLGGVSGLDPTNRYQSGLSDYVSGLSSLIPDVANARSGGRDNTRAGISDGGIGSGRSEGSTLSAGSLGDLGLLGSNQRAPVRRGRPANPRAGISDSGPSSSPAPSGLSPSPALLAAQRHRKTYAGLHMMGSPTDSPGNPPLANNSSPQQNQSSSYNSGGGLTGLRSGRTLNRGLGARTGSPAPTGLHSVHNRPSSAGGAGMSSLGLLGGGGNAAGGGGSVQRPASAGGNLGLGGAASSLRRRLSLPNDQDPLGPPLQSDGGGAARSGSASGRSGIGSNLGLGLGMGDAEHWEGSRSRIGEGTDRNLFSSGGIVACPSPRRSALDDEYDDLQFAGSGSAAAGQFRTASRRKKRRDPAGPEYDPSPASVPRHMQTTASFLRKTTR